MNKKKDGKKTARNPHKKNRAKFSIPSMKSKSPPWKVLSPQDVRLNAEVEKKRRELAKQGITDAEGIESLDQKRRRLSKALLCDAERVLLNWKPFQTSTVPCGLSFCGSFLEKRTPPRLGVPEIAFLGRSNVGKSSLLNCLSMPALTHSTFKSDEARVGKTPGATASVNLYAMVGRRSNANKKTDGTRVVSGKDDQPAPVLGFVDLPGFGYAKLSKEVKESVERAAERYLTNRRELALGILLVDARREPTEDDRIVLAALWDLDVPLVVVATKSDKIPKRLLPSKLKVIQEGLGLPEGQPLHVSAVTGDGTKQLWNVIMDACEERIDELKEELGMTEQGYDEDEDEDEFDEETSYQEEEGEGPIGYQLDEDGKLAVPTDDSSVVSYRQGYDWLQGGDVMCNEELAYNPWEAEKLRQANEQQQTAQPEQKQKKEEKSPKRKKVKGTKYSMDELKKLACKMEQDDEL